jgi:hypothetical protein
VLAEGAARRLGQKVLIENRAGAGGTLAMPVLQQAAPDGYTLAQLPQTVLRAPWTRKVLWDPIRDTTPILQLSGVTFGIVVPAASPFKTLDDLFAHAKAHPNALSIATNGAGTTPHVVIDELFGKRGLSYIHVPYKGTSEQMVAVAAGQVMVGVNSNGFAPFVDAGTLRLLVTFGEQRTRRWPTVPTLKELGHPSWPCRPTAWPARPACRPTWCRCCTRPSAPPCRTRPLSPSWRVTTRNWPICHPRSTAARCARRMSRSGWWWSGWGWRRRGSEEHHPGPGAAPAGQATRRRTPPCMRQTKNTCR